MDFFIRKIYIYTHILVIRTDTNIYIYTRIFLLRVNDKVYKVIGGKLFSSKEEKKCEGRGYRPAKETFAAVITHFLNSYLRTTSH